MEKGLIFNIQKFSIHDGPGIRTTVFLKGCPLKCKWCSNPESQLDTIQVLCDHDKCVTCKTCINTCTHDAISIVDNKIHINHDQCGGCLQCVAACPQDALKSEGEYKQIQQVVDTCLQDVDFYETSGGGVTISGGEGMSQPKFVTQLATKLKENKLHLAIETTGYIKPNQFQQLAPLFDLLLFDIKHHDSNKHQVGTGVANELIIKNFKWAISNNIEVLPRIPVIPNFNDSLEDANDFADLLLSCGINKVQLLPFHQFGEKKYSMLNLNYELTDTKALHPEDLKDYQQVMVDKGINCFF